MAEVPMTKGVSLLSLKAYVERHRGPDGWSNLLRALPAEHAAIAGGLVLAGQWYPTATSVAAIDALVAQYGPDECTRSGEFGAEWELNAVYRFILRFTSPLWMMERGARLWSSYHSTGEWTIVGGNRELVGTLEHFGVVSGNFCRGLAAWFKRAGQLTGAKNMKVEHARCRATRAPACVFHATW